MANHAKVCTGKKLNPDEVNELVNKINREKLGDIFTITYGKNVSNGWGNHQWFLQYKDNDYITLVFWLSDEKEYGEDKNGEFVEYDDPKIISEQSCIEFRHGHSYQFMWWVEGVLRENLGKHYNARMWDDGTGWCGVANPDRYETFKKYVIRDENSPKDTIKQWKEFHFGWQKTEIPQELIDKLNLDF